MKTRHIVFAAVSIILAGLGACTQEPFFDDDEPEVGVMPLQGDDVLWVSSVPLGADVYIVADDESNRRVSWRTDANAAEDEGPFMSMHSIESTTLQHETGPFSQQCLGKTPLTTDVPDGNYIVGVQLDVNDENIPWGLAMIGEQTGIPEAAFSWNDQEVRDGLPQGDIGTSASGTGYLNDDNEELWAIVIEGKVRKVGKTYAVQKKVGQTATVIALFQRENQDPQKLYESLPADYNFRNRSMAAPIWEAAGVPKAECKKFHERMTRGGKAIYLGNQTRVMCEFTPLDSNIPSERQVGGFTMHWIGPPSNDD